MDRSILRRMLMADAERILAYLTNRQHVEPQSAVGDVLKRAWETQGICPNASDRALHWLQLDEDKRIGRLRRTELLQLARSIHRFWRATPEQLSVRAVDQ
jgi:hypothetical protein